MTIIGLDSSTEVCSAALVQDGSVIAERINMCGSNHAALLPLYVQELQAEAATRGLTIDGVALSEGPGSYTGLRIAASLAKGLCYGLDVPMYAIPTLAVVNAVAQMSLSDIKATRDPALPKTTFASSFWDPTALICPMIDARRMEVYCAVYGIDERQKTKEVQALEAKVIDERSFAELLDKQVVYFCGNGAEKCKAVIKHPNARWIDGIVPTGAAAGLTVSGLGVCGLGVCGIRKIEGKEIAYFEPNYLKEFIAAPSHIKGLH